MNQQNELTGFRISPRQRRLWNLRGGGHELLVQRSAWLPGAAGADPDRVRAAAAAVLGAHEAPRTTFQRPSGIRIPLQVVADEPAIGWRVAGRNGEGEDARALETVCREERRGELDPVDGPLVRVAWLPAAEGTGGPGGLVVTASALVADPRSLEIVIDGIARALAGDGGEVPDVPVQHAQFSEWQNQVAADGGDEEAEPPPRPALPFLYRRGGPSRGPPSIHRHRLPATLAGRLLKKAGDDPDERAGLLLAGWAVLLRSLSGDDELTIGCAVPVRPVDDLAGVVGPLAKVIPTTVRLRGDFRFSEVRERARAALRSAAERQEAYSWPAGRGGDGAGPALVFEASERGAEANGDARYATGYAWTEPCDLKLAADLHGDSIDLTWYGAAGQVSPRDLELLALRFRGLLAALAEDGDPLVEEAEGRLDPEEREMLLGFVAAPVDPVAAGSGDEDFLDAFRRSVASRPSEVAVTAGGESLDYAALARRSDAVAAELRRAGAGAETLVGLWADRSVAAVAGMLGILQANAAFVPLDPALPARRLAWIAEEVGLGIVVAGGDVPEALARERRVVSSGPELARVPEEDGRPRFAAAGEQLAYLLFTSGSAGQPKAVSVARSHLASYVREIVARLELEPGERYASVSTLAADLGNTMVFPALATGGTLVLFSAEEIGDPRAFAGAMAQRRIDNLKIVPTHLGALLQEEDADAILPAKRLILGGERTRLHLAERVLSAAPCAVYNHYGPTETTVGATTQDVRSWWRDPRSATVPVGRPLSETRVHVVDDGLRTAPLWGVGEIVIGGAHVTRGYHGRPAETAEVFVPDPFVAPPGRAGSRLYRTGDLGRVLGDGSVEFLGRRDRQLKIRGFRVEIGEIEAVLCRHPSIDAAVVVARGEDDAEPGGVRLVAYVVLDGAASEAAGDLQAYLRAELPVFMVPGVIEELDALPRTPNGKVDVSALPEPGAVAGGSDRPYVAPGTMVEELVAALWSDLLGRERVGLHDDFFEIGGHSLLAMQLLSRLRKTFSIELPMPVIFDRSTVAGLAEALEANEPAPGHAETVARVHLKVRGMSAEQLATELEERAVGAQGARG